MRKIIDIAFKEEETELLRLQDLFNHVGTRALFMSHYELEDETAEST